MDTQIPPTPFASEADVIAAFGGPSALAAELGLGRSAVSMWISRGGIPYSLHQDIVDLAVRRGITGLRHETLVALRRGRKAKPVQRRSTAPPGAGNDGHGPHRATAA